MKDTVTEYTFTNTMTNKYNNFTYEGSKALYNYLQNFEEETETELRFDPVALRCDYSEYKNLNEIIEDYQDIKTLEDLQDHTTVILINESNSLTFDLPYPTKLEPRNREQITNDLIAKGLVQVLKNKKGFNAQLSNAELIFDTEKQEQKLIDDKHNKQLKYYNQQVKEYNKNNIHSYDGIIIQNF